MSKKEKTIGIKPIGSRTLIGILCLLAALGISFGLVPFISGRQDAKVDVVRAARTVSRGSLLTSDDLETVSVGTLHLPENVLRSTGDVIGKYATCDLYAGDYLFPAKLTSQVDTAVDLLDCLDGDHRAMSVSIGSFAAGVSGKLETGDIVSVIVYSAKEDLAFTPEELTYVKVITSTTSQGVDKADVRDGTQPVTVTLLVNKKQAELLARYEKTASMHFTLEYRGDAETAKRYLDAQQAYFEGGGVTP